MIKINPADLSSADLGGGYTLVFQRMKNDPTRVRAVVKELAGRDLLWILTHRIVCPSH